MSRTLYLNEAKGLQVLRDGQSVWIEHDGSAGQRIPARLVGRVIIIGNVRVDAGVITLFTENNIPVTFMNHRAGETAVAMPYNHHLPRHYRRQRALLKSRENIERYRRWAEAKRMVIQVGILKRLLPAIANKLRWGLGEGNYQHLISKMKPLDKEKWTVVAGVVNNFFRNMIIEHLLAAELDPHLGVLHRRHNFGLALDICHIMGAESDIQCLQFLKYARTKPYMEKMHSGWTITSEGMKNIIQRFENRREALSNMVGTIIDELFELMRELRA
jgi:hypothetical protein